MPIKIISLSASTPEVQQFIDGAMRVTQAAAAYAAEQYSDPETNGMLAEIQVVTASLQAAVQTAVNRASSRPMAPEDENPETKPAKKGRG